MMRQEREERAKDKPEARRDGQEEAKKPYESPRLLRFGPVEKMTGPAPS